MLPGGAAVTTAWELQVSAVYPLPVKWRPGAPLGAVILMTIDGGLSRGGVTFSDSPVSPYFI